MASEANRALLREAGLATHEVEAGPNDLLIAIEADSEAALEAAMAEACAAFDVKSDSLAGPARRELPRSLEMGLEAMPAANLALISTPGDYAAAEAMKALHLGLNVMLFSNNVAIEDEIALKRYAGAHGLMVMGPDCGTAILGGIPLGFANVVRRGNIGLVSASGSGLQQVTCLIDQLGHGVSQAIGTGGRDLRTEVGGLTMHQGLDALAGHAGTRVIVLISKAPAPEVAVHVLESARKAGKPVVVNFLGADPKVPAASNLHAAKTLEDAAVIAVALAAGRQPDDVGFAALSVDVPRPGPAQRYVRGLYSGGTFCSEARDAAQRARGAGLFQHADRRRRAPGRCMAQPRPHAHRSRRRRIHARSTAPDDRPSAAQRAHRDRGAGSADRRPPARRRSRLRFASGPGRRNGASGRGGDRASGRGRTQARCHRLRLRHRSRSAGPQATTGNAHRGRA